MTFVETPARAANVPTERERDAIEARMAHAPGAVKPFPWFYLRDVFPVAFYRRMLDALPEADSYTHAERYGERYFCTPETMRAGFWADLSDWLVRDFTTAAVKRFLPAMKGRLGQDAAEWGDLISDARLIMDRDGYEIWPHTDHPGKVLSLLFYLARDDSMVDLGTRIYEPTEPDFECAGLKRWPFDQFREVARAPFLPNSVFGFFKTPKAFHGVPAIKRPAMRRDVLLLNVYLESEMGVKYAVEK